jgi:hypothetical protein
MVPERLARGDDLGVRNKEGSNGVVLGCVQSHLGDATRPQGVRGYRLDSHIDDSAGFEGSVQGSAVLWLDGDSPDPVMLRSGGNPRE